jgi:hypothetical protein
LSERTVLWNNMSAPPRTQVRLQPLGAVREGIDIAAAAMGEVSSSGTVATTHATRWAVIDLAQRVEAFRAASHAGDPHWLARGVLALCALPRSTRAARARYASLLTLDASELASALERELASEPLPADAPTLAFVRKHAPSGPVPAVSHLASPRAAARVLAAVSGRVFTAHGAISLTEFFPATSPPTARTGRKAPPPVAAPAPVWELWLPTFPTPTHPTP